jgi:hypothetical protein
MAISLPLDKMSPEEKVRMMESLWDDLCRRADSLKSPAWHGDLLANREAAVRSGQDHFEDWESAKREIERDLP